jgi:hypothetical protein
VLDELRERVISYLSQHRVCVLATSGRPEIWATPVQYENEGLELICRLPHWSDALFHIEQQPRVMAVVLDVQTSPLRWLQYRGLARVAASTEPRYASIHITPVHIDLIDENHGWGARETLDL